MARSTTTSPGEVPAASAAHAQPALEPEGGGRAAEEDGQPLSPHQPVQLVSQQIEFRDEYEEEAAQPLDSAQEQHQQAAPSSDGDADSQHRCERGHPARQSDMPLL